MEYYGGDGGRRSFHIDAIRQLRQNAWLLPGEAPCRVCVLCGAENMTDQAQNALLKILEEPPEHTVFILTAENRSMLLPTILSRVQTLRLEALTPEEILPVLRQRCPNTPEEQLRWAAETADTIGAALALLADSGLQKHAQLAGQLLTLLSQGSEYELLALWNRSAANGRPSEVCTQLRRCWRRNSSGRHRAAKADFRPGGSPGCWRPWTICSPASGQNGNTLLLSTLLVLRLSQA